MSGDPRRSVLTAAIAILVFACTFVAGAVAASTDFAALATSPEATGDGPETVVAADLDGDTDPDLAVTNSNDNTVTILKNDGAGDFTEPASSPETVGGSPQALAAGDLDGDGDSDLVVANSADDNVTILRNGGAGNFAEPAFSPKAVGDFPFSLALADLDGDTDPDLAVANEFDDNVTVLRNSGAGNFFVPPSSPEATGSLPVSIEAADVDGDGDRDLAIANLSSSSVTVLKNTGIGNFVQPATSPELVGGSARSVLAVNVDGDGDRDLAVTTFSPDGVTILKNGGTGNFFQPPSSPEATGTGPVSVAAADFEGDGDQDLAVANAGSGDVTILRNNGTGNFSQPTATSPEPSGIGPSWIVAIPLDADADADLAIANFGADNLAILGNL